MCLKFFSCDNQLLSSQVSHWHAVRGDHSVSFPIKVSRLADPALARQVTIKYFHKFHDRFSPTNTLVPNLTRGNQLKAFQSSLLFARFTHLHCFGAPSMQRGVSPSRELHSHACRNGKVGFAIASRHTSLHLQFWLCLRLHVGASTCASAYYPQSMAPVVDTKLSPKQLPI